jgi:ribosome-associated translation inhibitor RaiA
MISIIFKNFEKSEMSQEIVKDRIEGLIEKFPDLVRSKIRITFEMENSPTQAGPDLFKVKLHVSHGRYAGITLEKSHSSLYNALADVMEHMLETLNRTSDRVRVKERARARKIGRELAVNFQGLQGSEKEASTTTDKP